MPASMLPRTSSPTRTRARRTRWRTARTLGEHERVLAAETRLDVRGIEMSGDPYGHVLRERESHHVGHATHAVAVLEDESLAVEDDHLATSECRSRHAASLPGRRAGVTWCYSRPGSETSLGILMRSSVAAAKMPVLNIPATSTASRTRTRTSFMPAPLPCPAVSPPARLPTSLGRRYEKRQSEPGLDSVTDPVDTSGAIDAE